MHRSARARWKEEIRFAEGDDSHVPIPKDLLVPVYVKVFRAGGVEDGLKEVGCILGGTVLQPFLGALVWGHPSSLARTGYCVLVFVLCLPCDHAAFCFCCWLGVRIRWQAEALRPYTITSVTDSWMPSFLMRSRASASTFSRLVSRCHPPMISLFQSTSKSMAICGEMVPARERCGDKVAALGASLRLGGFMIGGGADGVCWRVMSWTCWARLVTSSWSLVIWDGSAPDEALWVLSRACRRDWMDVSSNELVANWAEWESTVSEMVFCCAWIRSSFWTRLCSIFCMRAWVIWTRWWVFVSSGLVRVSASASKGLLISNSPPRYFFCGGDPSCIVGLCCCLSSSSASISMGELMGETGYILSTLLKLWLEPSWAKMATAQDGSSHNFRRVPDTHGHPQKNLCRQVLFRSWGVVNR